MTLPESGERARAERNQPAPLSEREASVALSAVRATLGGNREAFSPLVELHQRRLFGLVLMIVRDPSGAEEVTQDAFVRAFTHLHQYDERRPFYPWLATIAVRLAQTWLRRHQRRAGRESTALRPDAYDHTGGIDPLAELMTDESGRRLWRHVAALPSGQRTVVLLYYRREMKLTDIAHALGVTTGTVKTLLFRARRRLRETVENRGGSYDRENQT